MPMVSWADRMKAAEEGAKEFAILPEGMYSFVIKDPAKVGETKSGNPRFTINPTVESGDRANARVFHDFFVSDSAFAMKKFFFDDLAILGLGVEFFNTNPSPEQIAQALQGKRFTAEVFHEDGTDGKKRARLRNFGDPVGPAPAAGVPGGLPGGAPVGGGLPTGAPAGLPTAAAVSQQPTPVANAAAPANTAPANNPWETAAPAAPQGGIQLPPAFS